MTTRPWCPHPTSPDLRAWYRENRALACARCWLAGAIVQIFPNTTAPGGGQPRPAAALRRPHGDDAC